MRRLAVNQILVVGLQAPESNLIQRHFPGKDLVCLCESEGAQELIRGGDWEFIFVSKPDRIPLEECLRRHVPLVLVSDKPPQDFQSFKTKGLIETITHDQFKPQILGPLIDGLRERRKWEILARKSRDIFCLKDARSGAFHKNYLEMRLMEEASRSERFGFPVTFVVFKINEFNRMAGQLNENITKDLMGHCVKVLNRNIRASDLLAQISEDTLGLLLPHTIKPNAHLVARRLSSKLETQPFIFNVEKIIVRLSFSLKSVPTYVRGLEDFMADIQNPDATNSLVASS